MTNQFAFSQATGIFLAFVTKVVMQYFFPLSLSGWKGWLLFFICSLLFSLLIMEADVRLRKRAAYKRMKEREKRSSCSG